MKTIVVFAGTTEGRVLAERLANLPVKTLVSVATGYGGEALAGVGGNVRVRVGRMDAAAMASYIRDAGAALVVDATHPYAAEASAAIAAAAGETRTPLVRLAREPGEDAATATYYPSAEAAADAAAGMDGNILIATGSTRLDVFSRIPGFAERCFVRVLPTVEAIRACEAAGCGRSRIIAMQGPFTRGLNRALFEQYSITVLITKDGGRAGGFEEKVRAAADVGVRVLVVGRPADEGGVTVDEALARVARLAEEEDACG